MREAITEKEYDAYSLWRGYGANSSTNAPIFRMECELVAQAVLWEMTRDVSTEDVCIRGVSPSSIERPARGVPLRQVEPGILTERAKIIGMVTDELAEDYPGWRILPYMSILFGYGGNWRRGKTNSQWNTDNFGILSPPIITPFGPAQSAEQLLRKVTWQEACLGILRAVEPDNNAWV